MDAKEIYQAVLADCTAEINRIKDEYGEALAAAISDRLSQQYSSRIDNLEKQNRELIIRLEKVEAELQRKRTESKNKNSKTNTIAESNSSSRINIDYEIRANAIEYNGWYYYANKKMGNFLYRVRTDGTGNEQLTDYSVLDMYCARIKNGKIYFEDSDYEEHSINI